jgi:O-antigen ligase
MKLHQILFCLLIILLPVQLGKHFWPDWALIYGVRINYLSPTIFLTDILILTILLLWGWEKLRQNKVAPPQLKPQTALLFFFSILLLIINCLLSIRQGAALYHWAKLFEFILLGFYIFKNAKLSTLLSSLLSIAVVYSSLLAIFQFLKQGSLGGVFWWLGERTFSASTIAIALTSVNGSLFLRPYATFPHPNVLAGFLAVILPVLIMKKPKFYQSIFILGTVSLFLTFSRSAWISLGLSLAIIAGLNLQKKTNFKPNKTHLLLLIVGVFFILASVKNLAQESQADPISLRKDLNLVALRMARSSPLIGVGLGNFLVVMPEFYKEKGHQIYYLQPVHNIYLLILAETGAIGLTIFFLFILLTVRVLVRKKLLFSPIILPLFSILFLGLFDHYFLTLQQGQILTSLFLGLSWAEKEKIC